MNTEIVSTEKGWRIRTGKNAWINGVFRSFVKAEAAEQSYIKRSKVAKEKSKVKYRESK